ncbi:MAG: hypothetical protein AAFX93_04055 [Verrucomicrobiota bacterium]
MSLQSIELTMKKNPQGVYQVCHVRDDGELHQNWFSISIAMPSRVVESRGHTTIFRAAAPEPRAPGAGSGSFGVPKTKAKPPSESPAAPSVESASIDAVLRKLDETLSRLQSLEDKVDYLVQSSPNLPVSDGERLEIDQMKDDLDKLKFRLESA